MRANQSLGGAIKLCTTCVEGVHNVQENSQFVRIMSSICLQEGQHNVKTGIIQCQIVMRLSIWVD